MLATTGGYGSCDAIHGHVHTMSCDAIHAWSCIIEIKSLQVLMVHLGITRRRFLFPTVYSLVLDIRWILGIRKLN